MITVSPHAEGAMRRHAITRDDVIAAVVDGKTEFEIFEKGEKRYGNVLIQKHRKILAIWTWRNSDQRIITFYPLRREV